MAMINTIKLTGISHQKENRDCDDACFTREQPLVCCLADGVSNSSYGGTGAKALVNELGEKYSNLENLKNLANLSAESIREVLYRDIIDITNKLCIKYNIKNKNEFASTFLMCFEYENEITIVHCGDGAILARNNTNRFTGPLILSYPDNDNAGHVYHAAHDQTKERMRVLRLLKEDLNAVLLGTDGFTGAYLEPSNAGFDGLQTEDIFRCYSDQDLSDLVNGKNFRQYHITDDISAILIHFDDNKIEEGKTVENQDFKEGVKETNLDAMKETKHIEVKEKQEGHKMKQKVNKNNIRHLLIIVLLLICIITSVYSVYKDFEIIHKLDEQEERYEQSKQDFEDFSEKLLDSKNKDE